MCSEKQKEEESSNSSSAKQDDSKQLLRNVSGLIFFIWLLYLTCAPRIIPGFKCLVYWLLPHGLLYDAKGDINWGTLGDYFGALNCLFAGLAFAAVYVSIKQQSASINIQQKELKAQLTEMINSVNEAKAQNALQREYQFSDEFYRRINLLKLIEKDIRYKNATGQQAVIRTASQFHRICECVLSQNYPKAIKIITKHENDNLKSLLLCIDTFSVWMETYIGTLKWVHNYISQSKEIEISEIKALRNNDEEKEKMTNNITEKYKKKESDYEDILISSTIWASQYLLAVQLEKHGRFAEINALLSHSSFANGKASSKVRDILWRKTYSLISSIKQKQELEEQLRKIYEKVTASTNQD